MLALDAAPSDAAPSWRARGAALVDALPYVDSLTPSERALADRLIEAEVCWRKERWFDESFHHQTAKKKNKELNLFFSLFKKLSLTQSPLSSRPRPRPRKTTSPSSPPPETSTRASSAP